MAKQVQVRRGTSSEMSNFTGAEGEVTYNTTIKTLVVHDGSTKGGITIPYLSGGLVPVNQLPTASITQKGVVQLNDSLSSNNATLALTASQGFRLNSQDFGIDQSITNVTGSRALNTNYTNSTQKLRVAIVTLRGTGSVEDYVGYVNGVQTCSPFGFVDGVDGVFYMFIPPLMSYRLNASVGGIVRWVELG